MTIFKGSAKKKNKLQKELLEVFFKWFMPQISTLYIIVFIIFFPAFACGLRFICCILWPSILEAFFF